jgi:hypothetical protein
MKNGGEIEECGEGAYQEQRGDDLPSCQRGACKERPHDLAYVAFPFSKQMSTITLHKE